MESTEILLTPARQKSATALSVEESQDKSIDSFSIFCLQNSTKGRDGDIL